MVVELESVCVVFHGCRWVLLVCRQCGVESASLSMEVDTWEVKDEDLGEKASEYSVGPAFGRGRESNGVESVVHSRTLVKWERWVWKER